MTVKTRLLLPLVALLAFGGTAQAQEWGYPRGYVDVPNDGGDDGYYMPRGSRGWQEQPRDYRADRRFDDAYDYRDDPNGYYGDEDGGYPPRRRPKQQQD